MFWARSPVRIKAPAFGPRKKAGERGFKSHRARQKQDALAKSSLLQTALPTGLRGCPSHYKQLNYTIEFYQVKVYMAGVLSFVNGGLAMYEFDVVIFEDESGGYVAFVPALPGCHTQGDTLQELMDNVREAVELYLETLTEEERKELLRQRVVGIQKVKALS